MDSSEYNKDYIVWDDKFSIGIPVIDEQHKKLVLLTNEYYQSVMTFYNEEDSQIQLEDTVIAALKACVDYVQVHFTAEEKLMIVSNYPGYKLHKQQHNEFSNKVLQFSSAFEHTKFTEALNFAKFLYDWVLSHIAHEDRLYVKSVLDYYKTIKK